MVHSISVLTALYSSIFLALEGTRRTSALGQQTKLVLMTLPPNTALGKHQYLGRTRTMNRETNRFQRTFLAKWILVTSGAFILALPISFIVPQLFQPITWAHHLAVAPIIGAVVGCAQWLMLRKRIALSGWWVLACAIGLGLPPVVELIAS